MAASQTPSALSVHRCRFVDYSPSAITAIAFPPLGLPTSRKLPKISQNRRFGTLAVGRANGNIELCEWAGSANSNQSEQGWTITKILFGPVPSKVDSLVFTLRYPHLHTPHDVPKLSNLRLFSSGGGSELIEWDLMRGTILRTISSQGGAIWSIAANPASTLLALGCEDGCVRLLSLDADSLEFQKRLDRVKCRILSIAWGPPDPPPQLRSTLQKKTLGEEDSDEITAGSGNDEGEWTDSWIVTGGTDSSVRKWDVSSGRVLDRMSTDKSRGSRTLVWSVGVLADGTIVSGDSLGMVKFWDSRTCTQLHSFPAHGADVLSLAIAPDGNSVFTSGVDQKVCQFVQVKSSSPDDASRAISRWISASSKRMHSHDVRSVAIWPPYAPIPHTLLASSSAPSPFAGIAPVLVSGGLDASPVLAPCASAISTTTRGVIVNPLATSIMSTFEDAYHRRMAYTTGAMATAVHIARSARLLISVKESSVGIWSIKGKLPKTTQSNGELHARLQEEKDESGYEKLLDMDLDMTTNICASAVSGDGRWLAVADVYETKMFELRHVDGKLRPRRLKSFMSSLLPHFPKSSTSEGSSALNFSPDSSKLVLATALSGNVVIVDLVPRPPPSAQGTEDSNSLTDVVVLRKFEHHRRARAMFGPRGRMMRRIPRGSSVNHSLNGVVNGDINMDESDKDSDEEGVPSPLPAGNDHDSPDTDDQNSDDDEEEEESCPSVTRMAFSPDGQWLATTDDHCRTHIFNLDSLQHHTMLPTSPVPVHALGFSSSPYIPASTPIPETASTMASMSSPSSQSLRTSGSTSVLVMAHADNSLAVYDVDARRYPEWARHLCSRELLPKRFRGLHDTVLGVAFNPASINTVNSSAADMEIDASAQSSGVMTPSHVTGRGDDERYAIFWGATWLCKVTLDAPAGWGGFTKKRNRDGTGGNKKRSKKKSRHQTGPDNQALDKNAAEHEGAEEHDEEDQTNFKVITKYRPILAADFVGHDELVVVERPLVDVLAKLPPAFFKPKYGT